MKKTEAENNKKAFDLKKYVFSFIKLSIFMLIIDIISNSLKGIKILDLIDILAISISSFIIITIKFLYDKLHK